MLHIHIPDRASPCQQYSGPHSWKKRNCLHSSTVDNLL